MKSMLYVGATLMIGASIYGFVDYRQTSNKKEFTRMYEPAEKKTTVVTPESETPSPRKQETVAVVKKPTRVNITNNESKKYPDTDEYLPAVTVTEEEILPNEAVTTVEVITEKEKLPTEEPRSTERKVVKKKKKKLNHRLFSRAPLREEEEMDEAPVKEVVKKTGNKEQ